MFRTCTPSQTLRGSKGGTLKSIRTILPEERRLGRGITFPLLDSSADAKEPKEGALKACNTLPGLKSGVKGITVLCAGIVVQGGWHLFRTCAPGQMLKACIFLPE